MFPPELMKNLSEKDMKQAQNLWKFLDDLSESNPDEYKKFIEKNVQEGLQSHRQEEQKGKEADQVTPTPWFVFKITSKLDSYEIQPGKGLQNPLSSKLLVTPEAQKETSADPSAFHPEPTFIFNVLHHERVVPPLDEKNEILAKLDVLLRKQRLILVGYDQMASLSGVYFSSYLGDVVVNSGIHPFVTKDRTKLAAFISSLVSTLQFRLKKDANVLLTSVKIHHQKIYYYDLIPEGFKMYQKKIYKSKDPKDSNVAPHLIDKNIDTKYFKKQAQKAGDALPSHDKPPVQLFDKVAEVAPKTTAPAVEIPGLTSKKEEKTEPSKKPLIQEMDDFIIPNYKSVSETGQEIVYEIYLDEIVESAKNIALDVAEQSFIVESLVVDEKNAKMKLKVDLPVKVKKGESKAKWDKKAKKLTVTLQKI